MQIMLARIISILLHPLIMPPLGLLLLFNSGTYLEFLSFPQKKAIFLILLSGTTILPLSIIPVMMLQNMIGSLKMEKRQERVMPLLITVIFYGFTWYMLSRLNVPGLISVYTITASITVLICALVSIRWMISLHMTALGALAGMILAISFRFNINLLLYLSAIFLAGGAAGWARLFLKAHTPAQVYIGYGGGLALSFFMMYNF
jgi:hypothetical protein